VKFENKFIVIFTRYGHFTVDPNIDPDSKIDPYFDPIIFVFVLLFVNFITKQFDFFSNQQSFTF
jgi:hypothetical protein